jgi:hypothetical protein
LHHWVEMKNMTKFQRDCESGLKKLLESEGHYLADSKIEGQSETIITGLISGTQYKIFIYEDEACILGANTDFRFERPDYDSPEALQKALLKKVKILLSQGDNI